MKKFSEQMNKNKSIIVHNVSRSYDEEVALKNVSFEVNKGEIFGFIGPDGAGKTTLFRIITTVLLADKGEVSVEGFDVVTEYKKIRKLIGYMPGRFSLYPDLSVEENLNFYATIFGTTVKENYHLIKDIYSQIEPFKKRLAGKLSGGMKQKLALSCALIHKPKVLVLDEPTTGVDAVSRVEFWEMLKILKKIGITIVVSTPYMDEASKCDRVALIQKAELMTVDKPENIINGFEKEILSIRADNIYKLLNDLRIFKKTDSVLPFGQTVHYIEKGGEVENINEIEKYLIEKGNKKIKIEKTKANIEDCFMDLMGREEEVPKVLGVGVTKKVPKVLKVP
ncbi:MAG: ABC transporter ATP-binding protein [Bacteroidota bacterium]|nr:ABC transporter ATP-binding protein [Bacteroidota bacterium]